ncbi:MAG: decarboxylating 6-phosphogluconate dehydrogenase [Acholeplasmataceae bacterium]|nr:decarboxylating 6-phosphogluconate dehydrogenase [Acholeplasmataceae bacterium]
MNVRMIGLGKMGFNMALNMRDHGHEVVGYDIDVNVREDFLKDGFNTCDSLACLCERKHEESLIIWLMIPNGMVDKVLYDLEKFVQPGDIVIDGGNSNFNVSIKRYQSFKSIGVDFIDMGTSGGTKGARHGLCLMAGGEKEAVDKLTPLFHDLSIVDGFTYVGKPGSGHFTKMIHNGIEYGMMQSIGEGFALLKSSPFELDYEAISKVWNHGSLISSTLMGYVNEAFHQNHDLEGIEGKVDDTGEGMWMIEEALRYRVSLPVITQSLFARFKSKDEDQFGEKVVAATRKAFGGHTIYDKK